MIWGKALKTFSRSGSSDEAEASCTEYLHASKEEGVKMIY